MRLQHLPWWVGQLGTSTLRFTLYVSMNGNRVLVDHGLIYIFWKIQQRPFRKCILRKIIFGECIFGRLIFVKCFFGKIVFSCPQQLNRWPCHWVSQRVTFWFWNIRQSIAWNLWPAISVNKIFEKIVDNFEI